MLVIRTMIINGTLNMRRLHLLSILFVFQHLIIFENVYRYNYKLPYTLRECVIPYFFVFV